DAEGHDALRQFGGEPLQPRPDGDRAVGRADVGRDDARLLRHDRAAGIDGHADEAALGAATNTRSHEEDSWSRRGHLHYSSCFRVFVSSWLTHDVAADLRPRSRADAARGVADFWFDRGTGVAALNGKKLTSLIIDPPDGRVPALTADARAKAAARNADN